MEYVDRSGWGARSPRSTTSVPLSARKEVTLHYSTGPTGQSVRSIQDFHMDGNGWSDIGYNWLVDDDGTVYEGRGWYVQGAHAAPRNRQGIGVCYIGSDGMSEAAKAAVLEVYDEACRLTGRTLARKGHRDINSTSCPGTDNYNWWKSSGYRDVEGTGGDDMVGLKKGDTGERVKFLQSTLMKAGFDLPKYGADGHYGDETAKAVLAARKSQGSEQDFGDRITGWAAMQINQAFVKAQAPKGGEAELPETIQVSGELEVEQ